MYVISDRDSQVMTKRSHDTHDIGVLVRQWCADVELAEKLSNMTRSAVIECTA